MDKELLKKIESLEKRISELESQKKDNLSMFGRSYAQVGNSNSDFLIKTKGLVKIQWGNKFIDLIKDGKINADVSFIFKVKDVNGIGIKDGLYVLDDESVYLKVDGKEPINIVGEIGNTFVSFLGEQETDSELKYTALTNIGFIYKDLDQVGENALKNGIIYIESEQKFYIVLEGLLSAFTVSLPNPITLQIVVAKTDGSKGAIFIKGEGISNSFALDNLLIYNEFGNSILNSTNDIQIKLSDTDKMVISLSVIKILTDALEAKKILSPGASKTSGFRLYVVDGKSTLEVDNIIQRDSSESGRKTSNESIHPTYWFHNNNVISDISKVTENDIPGDTESKDAKTGYLANLKYENTYKVGECIYVYAAVSIADSAVSNSESSGNAQDYYRLVRIPFIVNAIITEDSNAVVVSLSEDFDTKGIAEDLLINSLIGSTVFSIGNGSENETGEKVESIFLRRGSDSLDIIKSSSFEEEQSVDSINSRFGLLNELELEIKEDQENKKYNESSYDREDGDKYGVYSGNGLFLRAAYLSNYNLSDDDDSSRFASTEWVNKKLSSLNVDVDLSVSDLNVDVGAYFSQPGIWELFEKLEENTTITYLGQWGIITISKTDRDLGFSAIVKSKTEDSTWSHRSINGVYDSQSGEWYATSTYIIKDQFNPGYYWTKEFKDQKPTSPTYIGTTNLETVSQSKPYILYTNDGKVWKLVDLYIEPDPNIIYFSASGQAACTLEGALKVPMGFIGIVKADGTTQVKIGKSNYAKSDFNSDNPETGDIRGNIPNSTRAILIDALKDAKPGVIPSIPGLPTLFQIKVSDIATIPENCMEISRKTESSLSTSTIFEDSKIAVRDVTPSICRWTNLDGTKYNTTHPGTYKSIGDIEFWREDINIRILAGSILSEIFKSVSGVSAVQARDAVYSDAVGFSQSWFATHWENFSFFQLKGVCEGSFVYPTDDSLNAKAGLRMNNSLEIVCGGAHIYGAFHVTYRDYKWPESPDSNYPYLSGAFAIDDMLKVGEGYRLPYPVEISANLVFTDATGSYKMSGIVGDTFSITLL